MTPQNYREVNLDLNQKSQWIYVLMILSFLRRWMLKRDIRRYECNYLRQWREIQFGRKRKVQKEMGLT